MSDLDLPEASSQVQSLVGLLCRDPSFFPELIDQQSQTSDPPPMNNEIDNMGIDVLLEAVRESLPADGIAAGPLLSSLDFQSLDNDTNMSLSSYDPFLMTFDDNSYQLMPQPREDLYHIIGEVRARLAAFHCAFPSVRILFYDLP